MLPAVAREVLCLSPALSSLSCVCHTSYSGIFNVTVVDVHVAACHKMWISTEANFTGRDNINDAHKLFPSAQVKQISMPSILIHICECFVLLPAVSYLFHSPASFDSLSMAPIRLICIILVVTRSDKYLASFAFLNANAAPLMSSYLTKSV